jgi:serine/threonine-protein kinase RsbW
MRLVLMLGSTHAEVERLNREFTAFADRHDLSADVRHSVNLALEEIVLNVISHGYKGRDDQWITVEVTLRPDEITARVEDAAPPFNPLLLPAPDVTLPLEQRQPGGLGIHLSKKMLDGLQYTRVGGKNRLDLRKRL